MKRILCYGDSNTWGFSPVDGHRMKERWTRCLMEALPEAEILEEGLNGRNAVCKDPHLPEKCGFDSFKMMLMSHKPLDLVILMLGTNDLKAAYHCSALYIAHGLREYIRTWMNPTLYEDSQKPKLLVVAPVELGKNLVLLEGEGGGFDENSLKQSACLAGRIQADCEGYSVTFFDASKAAEASEEDGLHMNEENHRKLAEALLPVIESLLDQEKEKTEKTEEPA